MRYIFLLFIVVPIVEMWLLIEVGQIIGAPLTIAAVVLTAALGVYWLKQQGLSTLSRLNQRLSSGQVPAQEIAEGMLLAVAGALLLTPGFATDAIGFCCLFPPTRQWFAAKLFGAIQANIVSMQAGHKPAAGNYDSGHSIDADTGEVSGHSKPHKPNSEPHRSGQSSHVIDGDFSRED